jgi:RNA polymerase sigma-70 factor, ECF subfamily
VDGHPDAADDDLEPAARAPDEPAPDELEPAARAPDEPAPDERAPDERAPDERAPDERALVERALVERARADPSAFAELYRRYLPRVYGFAYRRTGSVEAAEDLTSAAFEHALRSLGTFRWQGGGFGPWLFRIVANELIDHYRRTGRAVSALSRATAPRLHAVEPEDPADIVDARDGVAELLAAMDRLTPRYQRALALRYLSGLSTEEAAAALGTTRATMAVVVFRATRALRRELRSGDGS